MDSPNPTFIAHSQKRDRTYVPSFGLDASFPTENRDAIHDEVKGIPGWLTPEDSSKLYELGYLAPGPFLEIGTFRGKSTTVLTSALRDAGRRVDFYSLDVDHEALESARATLAARALGRHVTLVHGTVTALFRGLPKLEPRFVFLDGDHSAPAVGRDLAALERRVPAGGLLLFHDFLDPQNDDPTNKEIGVTEAIRAGWVARDCEFAGAFGCTGLYRRLRGPQRGDDGDAPALIEMIKLDRLPTRLRVNLARPAKRFARRVLGRRPG